MEGITSTTFGYLIAFLLPGTVLVQALSYTSQSIHNLLETAKEKDPGLSIVLFLVILALISGLIVSSIRDVIMDRVLCNIRWPKIKLETFERRDIDLKILFDQEKRAIYESFIENQYRYHQFYGNMCITLLVLLISKYFVAGDPKFDTGEHGILFIGNIFLVIFLFFISRESLKSICERMEPFVKKSEE